MPVPMLLSSCPACPGRQSSAPSVGHGRRGSALQAVKEVFMPALSSTMTEGKITTWLKSPGDKVAKGESLVVVESDKADMEV